jgi:Sap-like sulfolipid-1-addressing protein
VLAEAAGFALLAAISPTALLVMAVFLGSGNPRQTALAYVAGAMLMSVIMAVAVLLLLRGTGLNLQRHHDPRYGLRLGLGVLALAAAVVVRWRRQRVTESSPARSSAAVSSAAASSPGLSSPVLSGSAVAGPAVSSPAGGGSGFMSRLVARPSARSGFAAGVILFAPSATFIAAVQVVATARASVAGTVVGLVIVVLVSVLVVWLPLLAFLLAPEATRRRLGTVNSWLRTRAKRLAAGALGVGGVILIVNGVLGLTGVL